MESGAFVVHEPKVSHMSQPTAINNMLGSIGLGVVKELSGPVSPWLGPAVTICKSEAPRCFSSQQGSHSLDNCLGETWGLKFLADKGVLGDEG